MNNQQKPLSYLSTKCVLQFCKADLRILISKHIPSLRLLEKSLPLKIKKLHLEPFTVRVNETEYRLEAIRKFSESPPFGSFQCDLDEYGVPDKSIKNLQSGDIDIEEGGPKVHKIEDQDLQTLDFIMSQFTRRDSLRWGDPIAQGKPKFASPTLVDPSYCDIRLEDYVSFHSTDHEDWFETKQRVKEKATNSEYIELSLHARLVDGNVMKVDSYLSFSKPLINIAHRSLTRIQRISLIEQLQSHILPLQHRFYEVPPVFKRYLRFTTVSSRGKTTETVEYSRHTHEAMKYLNEKLFGGRDAIQVDYLEVGNTGGVLRLPTTLNLKINKLRMQKNWKSVMSNFIPILDLTSFPLKTIESKSWNMYNLPHGFDVIHKATVLMCPKIQDVDNWNHSLISQKNKHCHLKEGFRSAEAVIEFIDFFIQFPLRIKDIGAIFTAGVTSDVFAMELYSLLFHRPNTRQSRLPGVSPSTHFPHSFTIYLTEDSELNVFGVDTSKIFEETQSLWILTIKVMNRRTYID
ncbi:unnamed protein product [Caenorhabditis brenneri]